MPRTINEGFGDFLTKLTPIATETSAAQSHRSSIKACIESNFGLNRFVRIGSFGNGTSISGYSDIDYLASIPTKGLKEKSSLSLRNICDALDTRFPSTGVRVSCPAVVVPFGTDRSEVTEIVPADYVKEENGHKIYDIADGNDGWMKASPDAHNEYVREIDNRLGGKVKPLIRFVKAWKYYQDVPISSFYLELRIAKYADGEKSIIFDIDMKNVLCLLRNNDLADMRDPMGVSGMISACKTATLLETAKSKLNTAATRAEKAREAANNEKISDAFYWWNLLFDDKFPSYYY